MVRSKSYARRNYRSYRGSRRVTRSRFASYAPIRRRYKPVRRRFKKRSLSYKLNHIKFRKYVGRMFK